MTSKHQERLLGLFAWLESDLASVASTPATERLAARARKRARLKSSRNLRREAIESFLGTNALVGTRTLLLTDEEIGNAQDFIAHVLFRHNAGLKVPQETLDEEFILDSWRFGPGASHGTTVTHPAQKFLEKMWCTVEAEPLVKTLRRRNAYLSCLDAEEPHGSTVVRGSKLATVPKNETTERTIALEPLGNMCLQLGTAAYLESVLRSIGLDIRKQQPLNRRLAWAGSCGLRSLATIDLKSASDLIGCDLVRMLFPPRVYAHLMKIRSSEILVDGKWVEMNMISTMGNGFTFPLMTFIIIALIYAMRCSSGGPRLWVNWKNTAVYGDDIIVPADEYQRMISILTRAGFVVNTDKSFSDGPFRESCGGDYQDGVNITPFYIESLCNDVDVFIALNKVTDWCSLHRVALFGTLRYLRGLVRGACHIVPEWKAPDSGWRSSAAPRSFKYLSRVRKPLRFDKDSPYLMPLACGGYVEGDKDGNPTFEPRSYITKYRVRKARIPKGWLDGADWVSRSAGESAFAAMLVSLVV